MDLRAAATQDLFYGLAVALSTRVIEYIILSLRLRPALLSIRWANERSERTVPLSCFKGWVPNLLSSVKYLAIDIPLVRLNY